MKISNLFIFCALIPILLPAGAGAHEWTLEQQPLQRSSHGLLVDAREKALEQRADQVIEMNDALIQRTIQANGGNYFHQGKSKILIFNRKIYKDFTMRIVSGNRLIIETEDGIFQMDVRNP